VPPGPLRNLYLAIALLTISIVASLFDRSFAARFLAGAALGTLIGTALQLRKAQRADR
jgi:hypothetical protein